MQNHIPASKQSPVATGKDVKPPVQNTSNFPQNTGKYVDSRPEPDAAGPGF